MRGVGSIGVALAILAATVGLAGARQTKPAAAAAKAAPPAATTNPVLVFDTLKGSFEIELFPAEAPKSVAHILELMKRNVYRGQRFHRVETTLAQIGDPQSRDMTKRDYWGTGDASSPIGVFELSKKRSHIRGAVGLAYAGNPASADSQFYIVKVAMPKLDGKYAIIGQVTTGMAVVDKIVVTDIVKDARVK
jgi:cyclophilin family peptidyl-prolyl cis-trans isomerase